MSLLRPLAAACLCIAAHGTRAAGAEPATPAADPKPTLANVAYGDDPRQVLDFWRADTPAPAPLVLYVHGGSWMGGSKTSVWGLRELLAAGISVASVEYRLVWKAWHAGVEPPVAWPMHDVARALQFVRSKAAAWHVDKTRICVSGNSAGACSGLWLAFHDDLADPTSSDPVARESTRLTCAAGMSAQTTLDPAQLQAWIPNIQYGGHAFGVSRDGDTEQTRFQKFLAERERLLPWIQEYSPYALVTPDDPPVYLEYVTAPAVGHTQLAPQHSANFGVRLCVKLRGAGVECRLVYPGTPDATYRHVHEFMIAKLKPPQSPSE